MPTSAPLSLEAAYRALDPQEVLAPGATSYTARPVAPLATLATQLRLEVRPGLHLVSGHIGSGKTTELRRLESELGVYAGVQFVPLDAISPEGRLATLEIAAALLVAVASMKEVLSLEDAARLPRVQKVLQLARARSTSLVANSALAGPGEAGLAGILSDLSARASIRNGGNEREAEQTIIDSLRLPSPVQMGVAPLIVLLDGLDKLSVSEIELALNRVLAWRLSLSLVATVPLSYLFTPSFSRHEGDFAGVHVVPALPVVQRDLQPNHHALAWFENVLVSRGVRELFDEDAIERLAFMTAGIIRDFVRSCREAVLAALVQGRERVDLEMANIALDEFALRMTRPVSGDDLRVLNVVAETGRVVGHSSFLALIDGGQIVEYRNGSNWYAVHPLLRDVVARFAEELAS